jgi:hypothetical protein
MLIEPNVQKYKVLRSYTKNTVTVYVLTVRRSGNFCVSQSNLIFQARIQAEESAAPFIESHIYITLVLATGCDVCTSQVAACVNADTWNGSISSVTARDIRASAFLRRDFAV